MQGCHTCCNRADIGSNCRQFAHHQLDQIDLDMIDARDCGGIAIDGSLEEIKSGGPTIVVEKGAFVKSPWAVPALEVQAAGAEEDETDNLSISDGEFQIIDEVNPLVLRDQQPLGTENSQKTATDKNGQPESSAELFAATDEEVEAIAAETVDTLAEATKEFFKCHPADLMQLELKRLIPSPSKRYIRMHCRTNGETGGEQQQDETSAGSLEAAATSPPTTKTTDAGAPLSNGSANQFAEGPCLKEERTSLISFLCQDRDMEELKTPELRAHDQHQKLHHQQQQRSPQLQQPAQLQPQVHSRYPQHQLYYNQLRNQYPQQYQQRHQVRLPYSWWDSYSSRYMQHRDDRYAPYPQCMPAGLTGPSAPINAAFYQKPLPATSGASQSPGATALHPSHPQNYPDQQLPAAAAVTVSASARPSHGWQGPQVAPPLQQQLSPPQLPHPPPQQPISTEFGLLLQPMSTEFQPAQQPLQQLSRQMQLLGQQLQLPQQQPPPSTHQHQHKQPQKSGRGRRARQISLEPRQQQQQQQLGAPATQGAAWLCVFCGIRFPDGCLYGLHQQFHDQRNPWHCSVCNYRACGVHDFNFHLVQRPHPLPSLNRGATA